MNNKETKVEENKRQLVWDLLLGADRKRKLTLEEFLYGAQIFNQNGAIENLQPNKFFVNESDVRYCVVCKVEECGHGLNGKCPTSLDESDANVLLREARDKGHL